jgi:CheY-like chemotaxis protein
MSKPLALIIEDDFDLSEIFSATLQSGGFETEMIRDGQAALNRLAGTPPDLIVLDLNLPHVSGATLLKQIHADQRLAQTAIIITTANAQLAEELQGNVDLVLLKPVSIDQLRELAKRMLLRR